MSTPRTPPAPRRAATRLWRRRPGPERNERGAALITVMLIMIIVSSVVAIAATNAISDLNRAAAQVRRGAALHAAEAGVGDYVAKLIEDRKYYLHYVHPAESIRLDALGRQRNPGDPWVDAQAWTYPQPLSGWRSLDNGYEYNLEIVPPSASNPLVAIISTGRKVGSDSEWRRVEVKVRPSSVADFLLISNGGVNYRSDAITRGKVYAGVRVDVTVDPATNVTTVITTPQNVDHPGNAFADVLAEGQVTSMATDRLHDGARAVDSDSALPDPGLPAEVPPVPPIRREIPTAVNFNLFTDSMVDVQQAASTASGVRIDDPTVALWELTFRNDATIAVTRCTLNGDPVEIAPTCGLSPEVRAMPTNGAMYVAQSAIVRGVIDGQATMVANGDIIFGADLTYEQRGNDVIGLIARNGLRNPFWLDAGPDEMLTVHAAIIAQQDRYRSWDSLRPRSIRLHHIGSTATNRTPYQVRTSGVTTVGGIGLTRTYEYDQNLQFLQPPYYPALEDGYSTVSFRELPAPYPAAAP